jgi:class 3 adenylate cyclase
LKFSQPLPGMGLREPQSASVAAEIKPSEQICKPLCQSVLGTGLDMTAAGERSVLSKVLATLAAVALAIVLGVVDYLTGREWAISAFYLLPTSLAAWVAGRGSGLVVGALCTGAWFLSDMLNGATYQHPLIPFWNGIMLFMFLVVVVWLLDAFRTSHYRLEQTVVRRTAALQAEIKERKRLEYLRRTLGVHVGHKVAEQILARDPGVGGTEQEISVMFVDIRSFTARTANLKPDEAVNLLNQFLHAMVEVVEGEHGGMINKFLGDGFMALFGVDRDEHNHADRALAAGRDLERRLERLNSDLTTRGEEPIRIGIGINSGRAIVGSIGSSERMEFTVIGNTVNVASRIEALNKTVNTTLLISKATRDALRRPISLRALPRQAVEGVAQPLEIFTLDCAWT